MASKSSNSSTMNSETTWRSSLESYNPYLLLQKVSKNSQTYCISSSLSKHGKCHCGYLSPLEIKQTNFHRKNLLHSIPYPLKFLLFFLPISTISDLVGGIHFSTKKSMRTWGSNHRILKLPCWTSTSKNYSSSFHGI
jgi:hypothetical protein